MEANTSPTNVVYQVDDRTGPWLKVQKWMSDQDSSDQPDRVCQEGMYIKAIGHLKVFNNQRSVTAFLIKNISDFNEVTHHLAEVMACHLSSTKELPVVRIELRVFIECTWYQLCLLVLRFFGKRVTVDLFTHIQM